MLAEAKHSLLLLAAMMGFAQANVLNAEPLPPRAVARIGDHRFYHGPGITCAVLSPDGKRIASAAYGLFTGKERDAYSRTIILWDAATGERLRDMRAPHAEIYHLAFSPDGKCLAADYCISDEVSGIAVFAVETGKLLRRLGKFKNGASSVQFSADGKQLYVSERCGPVSAWDAATGKQLHLWKPPSAPPTDGSKKHVSGMNGMVSPDCKTIVWEMGTFSEKENRRDSWDVVGLRVHDAATDKLLYQKKFKHEGSLSFLTFSHDSKRFAAAGDTFTVWETATGKELAALDVPKTDISCLDPDGERVELPVEHGFALSPDGRSAVLCEWGSRLLLWNLESGKPARDFFPGFARLGFYSFSESQAFSADGKTLLAATDSTLCLFDTTTGKELAAPGHRAPITPRFSADGRTLFTSSDERRCRWDVSGKRPTLLKQVPRNLWTIHCLAHSAEDRFFLDVFKDCVRVRETATGRVLRQLKWNHCPDAGLFSADASRVLLWYDSHESDVKSQMKVRLYEVKTGKDVKAFKPLALVGDPLFSPNGRFVAWMDNTNAVHLDDAATGKAVRTLRSMRPLSQAKCDGGHLLFSSDGEQVIVTTYISEKPDVEEGTMLPTRVFHVSSGREIARFYANPNEASKAGLLSCLACSPDGRLLAVAQEGLGTIRLLEIAGGKVRVEFAGHRFGVHALAFAPDGKTLASGGEDNVVFLWDVTGAKTLPAAKTNLSAWWNDLASDDGKRAGVAIASMLRKPEASMAFLQEKLHPAEATDEKRLARLIADLDSNSYETRETASRELVRLGEQVEDALRRELMNRPSLEVRRRIEDVLSKLEPSPLPLEMLRTLRAIEVLEHIGTAAARRCLEALSKGDADARQTREAKAALARLEKRREKNGRTKP